MKKILLNKKGSALISSIIAFCVILIIAISVSVLSLTSVTVSAQTRQHNNAYYIAEAAVQKGMQQLKLEIGGYYSEMKNIALDTGYSSSYIEKYDGFYSNILNNTSASFTEPVFSESEYASASTNTQFSLENVNLETNIANMVVESASVLTGGVTRTVRGILTVARINLLVQGDSWYNPTYKALTVGDTLLFRKDFNDQIIISNGDAQFGAIDIKKYPFTQVIITGGSYQILPGLGNTIFSSLKYGNLTQYRDTQCTCYVTTSGGPSQSDVLAVPSYVEGAPGLSYDLNDLIVTGQVYSRGSLNIDRSIINGDIFCDGNLYVTRSTINGNIFCNGNVTLDKSIFTGEYTIDSTVDGALFAGGSLTFDRSAIYNGIMYATSDMFIKFSSIVGVVFCGEDIEMHNDLAMLGSMVAKKNLTFTNNGQRALAITYDSSLINSIKNNPYFDAFFNGTDYVMPEFDVDDIIYGESLYEK